MMTTRRRVSSDGIANGNNQLPTSYAIPGCVSNDSRDAIDLLASAGCEFMEWQEFLLYAWMGINAKGRWAAPTVANMVPRQNGKTRAIIARMVAEAVFYGGTSHSGSSIYTSQLQKTSTETFGETVEIVDTKALRKFLKPRGIKTALGREEIHFKNGAIIKFLARTRQGGNGQHGSLLVFDEAQFLDPNAQSSFKPAISANPAPCGIQTIYNGTSPEPDDYGLVFEKIRNDALGGRSPRTAYTEWSAGYGGAMPDPTLHSLWKRTNPSYGILIMPETVEAELAELDEDKFCYQRLGWWKGQSRAVTLIGAEAWDESSKDDPGDYERIAYGIKFTRDGACVALSVCTIDAAGRAYVDFVRSELTANGIGWLVSWLRQRADGCCGIAIDGAYGSTDLAIQLASEGVPRNAIMVARTADAIAAASMLLNALADGTLDHSPDTALRDSALGAVRRPIGSGGGFGFGGETAERVDSCALALWAARTSKRDPGRRAIVW